MTVLALPARLDSAAALRLAQDLKGRADADLRLDAAEVTLLGARALQTLLVAHAAWQAAGRTLTVTGLAPEVRRQMADLGLPDPAFAEGAAP